MENYEQKYKEALEAYPEHRVTRYGPLYAYDGTDTPSEYDENIVTRKAFIEGYDQAMKDIQEQAEKSVIEKSNGEVTIEDLVAYNQGFKTGRELTMQDFLEKAEEYLRKEFVDMWLRYIRGYSMDDEIEMFKNYMQDESEEQ